MPGLPPQKKPAKTASYRSKADLVQAFAKVLEPLIRVLLKHGVSFREFSELAKGVFVQVARSNPTEGAELPSIARLSIMCGLSRRECQEIVETEQRRQRDLATNTNRAARLLESWHTDPRFLGPYGFPRDLRLVEPSQSQPAATFQTLVLEAAVGMSSDEMAGLLIRSGAAVPVDDGMSLRVLQRTFIPNEMTPEMVQIFTEATSRYMEVVAHNLTTKDPNSKRFDRFVYPDPPIEANELDKFQIEMRGYLESVVAEIEQRISKYPRSVTKGNVEKQPIGVGLYFFREKPEEQNLQSG